MHQGGESVHDTGKKSTNYLHIIIITFIKTESNAILKNNTIIML